MADNIEIGLALSGGGYRAMLYSLGSLWRLNELGWLRRIDMITSVSGGSILNGVLATRWSRLRWERQGDHWVATNFADEVAKPVREVARHTIDVFAGIEGILSIFSTISDKVTEKYDEYLFNGATLQSGTPAFKKGEAPRFLFYATSLQTGSSVRIERKRLADYKIGEIPDPDLPVARVVAASSAFPPVLSPVELKLDPRAWRRLDGAFLFDRSEFKERLVLTDGGVYDNMGLEAIWDRKGLHTVLVSDAGAPFDVQAQPATDWTRQSMRVLDIITDQTRALRKRKLMQDFQQTQEAGRERADLPALRRGTYWGIKTKIDNYKLANALTRDNATTASLQDVRTRLNEFSDEEQGRLINWGYALADAAMRTWVDREATQPARWPDPDRAL
jgi:NTE family protein